MTRRGSGLSRRGTVKGRERNTGPRYSSRTPCASMAHRMEDTCGDVRVWRGGRRKRGGRSFHGHDKPFLASLPAQEPRGHLSAARDRQPRARESAAGPSGARGGSTKGPHLPAARRG